MCAFAPDFDRAGAVFSRDRADALVWAFADLLVEQVSNERCYEWARPEASGQRAVANAARHRADVPDATRNPRPDSRHRYAPPQLPRWSSSAAFG
jgi:hypothetical protein